MPQDVAELETYIKGKGLKIVAERMLDKQIVELEHLTLENYLQTYIVIPEQINQISIKYSKEQNYYWINEMRSPVIEFFKCIYDASKNTLKSGRLYFSAMQLSDTDELIYKNAEYIESAKMLFKWFKSNFKNQKINPLWTTQRVRHWVENEEGLLVNL